MPGRPLRAESLSETSIVDAALRLASRRGLEQVRMREVAKELDVAVGALYHHVPSQAAMQSAVIQQVLEGVPTPNEIGGTPRQGIVAKVRAIQQTLDEHRGISANVIAGAPETERGGLISRELLAALRETGLGKAAAERDFLGFEWLWLRLRVAAGAHSNNQAPFHFRFKANLEG